MSAESVGASVHPTVLNGTGSRGTDKDMIDWRLRVTVVGVPGKYVPLRGSDLVLAVEAGQVTVGTPIAD